VRTAGAVILLALAVAGTPARADAPLNPPGNTTMTATANELLQRYDQRPDLLLLRDAGEKLDQIDLFQPATAPARGDARLAVLNAWLQVLKRLDAAADPGFDEKNTPAMKLLAPDSQDPQALAAHAHASAANERARERAERYWNWRAIDSELSERARRFVSRFYTASHADQGELQSAMAAAATGQARRKQLATPAAKR